MSDLIPWDDHDSFDHDPPDPDDSLHKPTAKAIRNAWNRAASVSETTGRIWISVSELHTLLRTSKANARHILVSTDSRHRKETRNDKYISGSRFYEMINEQRINASNMKHEKYMEDSEKVYRSIRESSDMRLLRRKVAEEVEKALPKLKRRKKSEYNINKDELTGDNLLNDEFHHIMSKSMYREIADQYWNGVVVNKNTHKKITKEGCVDDDDLLRLCRKKGWSMDWYDEFASNYNSFYT